MAESLQFEIVTPSGVALKREVQSVTAPTLDGEIGVLPGHVPLLAAVRTGLVSIRLPGEADDTRYAVAHGVFEVSQEKALLMSERFAKKDDVDVVKTRSRLKEVDDELAAFTGELVDAHRTELIEEEQWLGTLLELIGDPPPPVVRELTRFQPKHVDVQTAAADSADDGGAAPADADHG